MKERGEVKIERNRKNANVEKKKMRKGNGMCQHEMKIKRMGAKYCRVPKRDTAFQDLDQKPSNVKAL